jgi:hypothetical protein
MRSATIHRVMSSDMPDFMRKRVLIIALQIAETGHGPVDMGTMSR